eukprot:CAMPEP_0172089312 /NCGR_PEP_ID=MMETSP1043-20130122/23724_1 /TAXON_ID=464988 /ORGANISM="Hemiselmis andersenii, Strain CCMP441" /LENGTH=68 /DNA_ID=CAMNT_0012751723 /DNA_START=70 /DNA_END=277 /DNA_ORIENTATION=-
MTPVEGVSYQHLVDRLHGADAHLEVEVRLCRERKEEVEGVDVAGVKFLLVAVQDDGKGDAKDLVQKHL